MKALHLISCLLVLASGHLSALTTAPILANPLLGDIELDFDNDGNADVTFQDRARLTTVSTTGFWHQHKGFVGFAESNIEIAINLNESLIFSSPPLDNLVFPIGVVPHRFEVGDTIDDPLGGEAHWSNLQRYNGLRIFEYEIGSEIDRAPIIANPPAKNGSIHLGDLWEESGYIGFRKRSDTDEFSYGFLEVRVDYESALFGLTGYAITDDSSLTVSAIPEASTSLIVVVVSLCAFGIRRKNQL